MNVQIIRSELEDVNSKTGVGNYADFMEGFLKDAGAEVEVIPFRLAFDRGISSAIKEGATNPIRKIMSGRKRTDIVHIAYEYCSVFLPLTKAKKVVTFHHVVSRDENNSWKWFILWKLSSWMSIVFADKIIAISVQTKEEILQKYRLPPSRIEVITHIPEGFSVLDGVEKEHVIGCMGTLNKRKNFAAAVRVFGSILKDDDLGDYRMTICGKGPLKDRLIEQTRLMGIENKVTFIEDLPKE